MDGAILVMRVKRGGAISQADRGGPTYKSEDTKVYYPARAGRRWMSGPKSADGAWADQYPVISR